jgi:putative cardiolipin synthase
MLDLQYYIWHEDVTGYPLIREVLHAAGRGVRVRLLLDDLYDRRTEHALATLAMGPDFHCNVCRQVRSRLLAMLRGSLDGRRSFSSLQCIEPACNKQNGRTSWIVVIS